MILLCMVYCGVNMQEESSGGAIMDAEFERRWRESLSPFDGATVALTQYLPLELLQQSLITVVE
jgi:hypothetical protein